MISHIWSILCRRSVIDKETNNLSIYDVFEQLGVNVSVRKKGKEKKEKINTVNVPIEFELVSMWLKDSKSKTFQGTYVIKVFNPSGKKEKEFEHKLEIKEDLTRMRTRTKFKGFTVSQSGNYIFEVGFKQNDDKKYTSVAKVPLEVNFKIR